MPISKAGKDFCDCEGVCNAHLNATDRAMVLSEHAQWRQPCDKKNNFCSWRAPAFLGKRLSGV